MKIKKEDGILLPSGKSHLYFWWSPRTPSNGRPVFLFPPDLLIWNSTLALFDSFKSKKDSKEASMSGSVSGDTGFGNGIFAQDPRKARRFFEHAEIAAQARNYDFAMDHYISGLRFDPDNLQRHQELRETALKRKSTGGKGPGLMGIPKVGDTAVDKMLTAEKEWAMDPSSPKLLLNAIHAGMAAQAKADELAPPPAANGAPPEDSAMGMTITGLHLHEVIFWLAEQCLDVIYAGAKPDAKNYIALVEVFTKLGRTDKAIEACKRAVQLDPDNRDLILALRDLDAKQYSEQHTSTKKGGFRENLSNAKGQAEIQADITSTGVGVDDLIAKRRAEWQADPDNLDLIQKLVDTLLKKEDLATEKEAIGLLIKAYEATQEYRYRTRAADIQMQQFNRVTADLKKRYQASKKPEDKEVYAKVRAKQGKFELDHFIERAAQYPTDMKVRFELGKRQWKGQLFDDAIASFQGAKNDPKSRSESNYYLGLCYGQKGWLDEAVEALETAMDEHQFEDDRLGKEIRYELMLALARAAKGESNIEKAEKAQKIASSLLQIDINYRDIREKIEVIRTLTRRLKGHG